VIGVAHWMILYDVIEPDHFSMLIIGKTFAFHPGVHPSLTTTLPRKLVIFPGVMELSLPLF
jgi:hypothetical protein